MVEEIFEDVLVVAREDVSMQILDKVTSIDVDWNGSIVVKILAAMGNRGHTEYQRAAFG